MFSRHGRPILVTGSHRSGSTWVGRMIASHPGVHYVKEPFNPDYHPDCPCRHQWHHVTDEDAPRFRAYLRRQFAVRHSWWADVRGHVHPRRFIGATVRALEAWRRRLAGSRPLMKDPIAFFSAEWLANTFDMDVVVLVRHPAAFASSVKRLDWRFAFEHLLIQPRLLETYLAPFEEEIRRMCATPADLVDQAILSWRLIHHVILEYRQRHPEWTFLRHEDLSLRPVEGFAELFGRLGLDFPDPVRRTIEEHSAEGNVREDADGRGQELRRDSKANVWNWAHRLRPEEVARVRLGTEGLANIFYPEAGWWDAPAAGRASA